MTAPTIHTKRVAESVHNMVEEWFSKFDVPHMSVTLFEGRIARFHNESADPDQSSALAAIESAAEARGLRKAADIVKARAALYAKKRDADGCDIDTHMTLIHTVESHEYAVDAILAAIPQGEK